jgi:hypothetical protein
MTELATTERAENYARIITTELGKQNPHRRFDIYTKQILFVASRLHHWEMTYQQSFIFDNPADRETADYKRIAYGVAMKWIVNRANLLEL